MYQRGDEIKKIKKQQRYFTMKCVAKCQKTRFEKKVLDFSKENDTIHTSYMQKSN